MHHQEAVLNRYPEAQAVEELLSRSNGPSGKRGHWFIYAGPEPDSRVLGHGAVEDQAWANAARRVMRAKNKVRWLVAG
jgi:hypothetical protein